MNGDYVQRLRTRAEEERRRALAPGNPTTAAACLQLAEKFEAVASAYERLGTDRAG